MAGNDNFSLEGWNDAPPPDPIYTPIKDRKIFKSIEAAIETCDNEYLKNFISKKGLKWIPDNKFDDVCYLGEGGFAKVYSATLKGSKMKVALKTLKIPIVHFESFIKEWEAHVNCLDSCEIVDLLGFTKRENTYMAVLEYANKGTLSVNLKKISKTHWKQRLYILYRIALGLKKIHEKGFVHCDLHHGNILFNTEKENGGNGGDDFVLDGEKDVWICDLGLCRAINSALSREVGGKFYGLLEFAAPEILKGQPYTPASDMYSFSMIMWELTSGVRPYDDKEVKDLVVKIAGGEVRPGVLKNTPSCYETLMRKCWDNDPLQRPTSDHVASLIRKWISRLSDDNRNEVNQFMNAESDDNNTVNDDNNAATATSENSRSGVININMLASRPMEFLWDEAEEQK